MAGAAVTGEADTPTVVPQGLDGWVVRFSTKLTERSNRAALAFYAALEGGAVDAVEEASSALASVYVRARPDQRDIVGEALRRLVSERDFYEAALPQRRKVWTIPAAFGGDHGPALEALARDAGMSVDEAIDDVTQSRLRVLAIGFAPGQPYIGELSETWDLPRLKELIDVPAAALVVAIRQLVLFTNGSPTGWQHIAQTAFRTFRPDAADPFPLSPGDEIRFQPVSAEEFESIRKSDTTGDGGATSEYAE